LRGLDGGGRGVNVEAGVVAADSSTGDPEVGGTGVEVLSRMHGVVSGEKGGKTEEKVEQW
jgi:hypothetical protein